ncbi:rhomboid family intramembrane serine protease [Parasediminibacterium paludis]|uniref:Rhomboid family intramembrane serine protease n=1 Tax=Parasediminibacterium paludis TaxID=908966 RepID=A0ABV8Q1Y6_9BACT
MSNSGILGFILVIINVIVSYKGFTNQIFFDGYKFEVDAVLKRKDYKRLVSSGFLHVNWQHLVFNMFSLYVFSDNIELVLGNGIFLLIYFISLIGGNLLSLLVHRHHGDYSAVGASGAVSGIIFAAIALQPSIGIGMFFIYIPGWLYGIVFVAVSIYGIKSQKDNIGHEAHLGGALVGMLAAIVCQPEVLRYNYIAILLITVPAIIFIYLIITKPHILLVDNLFVKNNLPYYTIDQKYNAEKKLEADTIDAILDKINRHGINSLSKREKDILNTYSKR